MSHLKYKRRSRQIGQGTNLGRDPSEQNLIKYVEGVYMKKQVLLGALVASTVLHGYQASAQDAGRPGRYPENPGQSLPAPPAPVQSRFQSSVGINDVSRKAGGTWYRVSLRENAILDSIEIRAVTSKLKIHQASLILSNGQRISVREFANTPVFGNGDIAVSESFNSAGPAIAVDLLLESYGGGTNISVTAKSSVNRVALSVAEQKDNGGVGAGSCSYNQDVTGTLSSISAELDKWSTRKSSYYSSSPEYALANEQIKIQAARLRLAAGSEEAKRTRVDVLTTLAESYTAKVGNYYSSSVEYSAYNDAAVELFNSLSAAVDRKLACGLSLKETLKLAEGFTAKVANYYSSSIGYAGFNNAAKRAYAAADVALVREAREKNMNYNELTQLMETMNQASSSYYSSSDAYKAYVSLAQKAGNMAIEDLRGCVGRLSADARFNAMVYLRGKQSSYYSSSIPYQTISTMLSILEKGR